MERIHVSVRARPLSAEDAKVTPWRISGNSICIPNQSSKFEFDRIFWEGCITEDVYHARTSDIVAAAVAGFNGTVFAYGQTSSGKTYTMRGTSSDPGVIPLAVHDLFNVIHQDMDREFLLRMSYMEIYNEEINDLLAPEHRRLQIHESIERGIYVAGLREEIVVSSDQVLELMEFGEAHRHIGETNMNLYSSRSHTIFRMIIESRERNDASGAEISSDAVRVSVLNLVDLAGSERASKTGAEGVRLKEGSHINKSLMTLGTVIKKLSEGAESQGGHVPYRDSKLTRILQPSLGGNANTAIICNITLAQVHVDETKSSLQFASRALHVTNYAHVNEIMTDAALLKRQKKEIEELRAKLQGLRSENLEEEILNLRNTLLKSELERERIALELEEEKRAQAEREKRLQEQEKKIENLSSMFFCAPREESGFGHTKEKRRKTWCPRNLAGENVKERSATILGSELKSTRPCDMPAPLPPFEELAEEKTSLFPDLGEAQGANAEDCILPDPHALRHVTSRQKDLPRKKKLSLNNNEWTQMHADYENLLLNFETHMIVSDIRIDCLMRRLSESDLGEEMKPLDSYLESADSISCLDGNVNLCDMDPTFVIKQLQEKIAVLEMEKFSSQQKLNSAFDLATEHIVPPEKKPEKHDAKAVPTQEAIPIHESLVPMEACMEEFAWLSSLSSEIQELELEFEKSCNLIASLLTTVDEVANLSSGLPNLITGLRASSSNCSGQMESIVKSHEKVQTCLEEKVRELAAEKHDLESRTAELQARIEELSLELKDSADTFKEYTKLEVFSSEMEATIASLKDRIEIANEEKSLRISRAENLELDFRALSEELQQSNSDLSLIKEKASKLKTSLEESRFRLHQVDCSLRTSSEEKEHLSMRLTEALASMEEEKAVWATKEKESAALISEIKQKHTAEIASLSKQLSEVAVNNKKEKAKLRMRLHGTGLKLESLGVRYNESIDEIDRIHRKYETASAKLKNQLASYGSELLSVKKQLAAYQGD